MSLLEKQRDLFTTETLRALLTIDQGPCVSIYLPTERKGPETQQNSIRLKNLLREAEAKLIEQGQRAADARKFLAPAQALLEDANFWQHQAEGLALFLQAEAFFYYRLPLPFEELVLVNQRFHIKPLLPILQGDGRFYLLNLDQKQVQLFQGTRYSLSELELGPDLPKSLAEELQYDENGPDLQFRNGAEQTSYASGERSAMLYGSGDAGKEAKRKEDILRFFRHLDNGIRIIVQNANRAPLVLVGVEYLQGLYREANEYPFLVEQGIEKDAQALTPEELHEQAWAIVEPVFQQAYQQAHDTYMHLAGTGDPRAVGSLEKIASAAYYQSVDTLFTPMGQSRWGRFVPEQAAVEIHVEPQPGDEDLFDFAAVHTILNGGTVYSVAPEQVPGENEITALTRFPIVNTFGSSA
ncbi:MAG: hypothetical protein NT075_30255 [Chloroflexi bacterium]|nr:hypothetical protein [Chloroflexota bacterium]